MNIKRALFVFFSAVTLTVIGQGTLYTGHFQGNGGPGTPTGTGLTNLSATGFAITHALLIDKYASVQYITTTPSFDSYGNATNCPILWWDGTVGAYTATSTNLGPLVWSATYAGETLTATYSYDSNANVTITPIVVTP